MTTDITALVPVTLAETKELATLLSKSNLLPPDLIGKEANVLMSIMTGRELGFPPMASIRGISIIKGRPTLTADLMCAAVQSRGLTKGGGFKRIEATATKATYRVHRIDRDEPDEITWTIEDAKTAGLLGKDNWKNHPRQMLAARCKAELARDVFPDVLSGCYTPEEAEDFVDEKPTPPSAAGFAAPPKKEREPDAVDAEIVESDGAPVTAPAAAKDPTPASEPKTVEGTTSRATMLSALADEILAKFKLSMDDVAEIDLMLHEIGEATAIDAMTRVGNICTKARKSDDDRSKAIMAIVWPRFEEKYRELKKATTSTTKRGSR